MIKRLLEVEYGLSLTEFPVTGIIGPRQVGKTTMVKSMVSPIHLYLDLERPSDLTKLLDPELFLNANREKTVILDEVQHKPDIFPVLRSLVDDHRRPGRFVILGSASPTLLRQSSESLAGRINYLEMFPFSMPEIHHLKSQEELWLNGGFPEPLLSGKPSFVQKWHRNFVQTYIERDLPLYGLPAQPSTTRRFLMMITSTHGQILNHSTYARSLGLSTPTIKTYLHFLTNAFLVYLLPPWHQNMKKRLVKSPKIFIGDTGMLHYLMGIETFNALIGHVVVGTSWEGFVINQIRAMLRSDDQMFFYRTQDGAEIDLLVRRNNSWLYAFEIEFTNAPTLTRGTYNAMKDLGIKKLHIITPGADTYLMTENVVVTSLTQFLQTKQDSGEHISPN